MFEVAEDSLSTVKIKSSFDGRLQYFDNVGAFLKAYTESVLSNDLQLQYRTLVGLFNVTSPYIKDEANEQVELLFRKIENNIKHKDYMFQAMAAKTLSETARKVFFNCKHLMLPQKLDDNEDINWDDF